MRYEINFKKECLKTLLKFEVYNQGNFLKLSKRFFNESAPNAMYTRSIYVLKNKLN